MQSLSPLVRRTGLVVGVLGGAAGLALHGVEGGFLGIFVGYFLGKSAQSLFWTLSAGGS